ncbi:unnamed protein product [Calicophoron daubneyi]|uniref:Mannosyltransferase n=1 Tax=Calicophoron daubneyi TaxID=300641 RepID=A0AAV2TP67_CALDB
MKAAVPLAVSIWALVLLCPYTKVEESFNMQAVYDLNYHKLNISKYDHMYFPGVVPRTFIGAIIIYLASLVPVWLSTLLGASGYIQQVVVRLCIGTVNYLCLLNFLRSVRARFGRPVQLRLIWLLASQFHLCFYCSRSLPNSLALMFVILSLSCLLRGRDKQFVCLAGFSILVFRSELLLFYGPCLLYGLIQGSVRIRPALFLTVLLTAVGSVSLSVLIDSFFWQRWLWPEGMVFYFNTILNKSSQWGVYPFHWYFTSALPRALLCTSVLLPLWFMHATQSLISRRNAFFTFESIGFVLAAFSFILLYSFLPHKELRFIIYTLPILNLATATLWASLEKQLKSSANETRFTLLWYRKLLLWFCYLHIPVNIICSMLLLLAARRNYPGGEALVRLNHWPGLMAKQSVHVHVCNLAAQTGITRFLEEHSHWVYNKTERIESNVEVLEGSNFTHLISEIKPKEMLQISHLFKELFEVLGYDGVTFQKSWIPINFRTAPKLFVYERT